MTKNHFIVFAVASIAGYFFANSLAKTQPFTWAAATGASLG